MTNDHVELTLFRGAVLKERWVATPAQIARWWWDAHPGEDPPHRKDVDEWIRSSDGLDSTWETGYPGQRRAFGNVLGAINRLHAAMRQRERETPDV